MSHAVALDTPAQPLTNEDKRPPFPAKVALVALLLAAETAMRPSLRPLAGTSPGDLLNVPTVTEPLRELSPGGESRAALPPKHPDSEAKMPLFEKKPKIRKFLLALGAVSAFVAGAVSSILGTEAKNQAPAPAEVPVEVPVLVIEEAPAAPAAPVAPAAVPAEAPVTEYPAGEEG
jgi:hypothetical protein